ARRSDRSRGAARGRRDDRRREHHPGDLPRRARGARLHAAARTVGQGVGMDKARIVLAYSGGLDTSAAIAWLAEQYSAEVIAVTLDLGQGRELTDVRERALAVGAARAHVLDVRDEFASDYILPALQAGALYEDRYPLATALSRPLIARKLVDVARMEGTTVIAHGCNGKANDELRLELGVRALDPAITVLAPARI